MSANKQTKFHQVTRDRKDAITWRHPGRQVLLGLERQLRLSISTLQLSPDSTVIDMGCANKPYKRLFPSTINYLGADLEGNPEADLVTGADGKIDFPSNSCDLILSTQVLEHVSNPEDYLNEAWRLLRPGGQLLLSTHGLWIYHEDPVDYWRWTGPGLIEQVRRAGFESIKLDGVLGLAALAVQLFQDATRYRLPRLLAKPYGICLQGLIGFIDRFHTPEERRNNALLYVLTAKKPV